MDGREKDGNRDRSGRKKRDGRENDRETGAGKREIGRDRGGRERDRGEREKITNTKNSWNFILSQNGVKHDSGL